MKDNKLLRSILITSISGYIANITRTTSTIRILKISQYKPSEIKEVQIHSIGTRFLDSPVNFAPLSQNWTVLFPLLSLRFCRLSILMLNSLSTFSLNLSKLKTFLLNEVNLVLIKLSPENSSSPKAASATFLDTCLSLTGAEHFGCCNDVRVAVKNYHTRKTSYFISVF